MEKRFLFLFSFSMVVSWRHYQCRNLYWQQTAIVIYCLLTLCVVGEGPTEWGRGPKGNFRTITARPCRTTQMQCAMLLATLVEGEREEKGSSGVLISRLLHIASLLKHGGTEARRREACIRERTARDVSFCILLPCKPTNNPHFFLQTHTPTRFKPGSFFLPLCDVTHSEVGLTWKGFLGFSEGCSHGLGAKNQQAL